MDASYAHSPCLHAAKVAGDITQESANFASKAASETSVELVVSRTVIPRTCCLRQGRRFRRPRADTPLGRAEWIKFLATFFNEEDRANLVFSREKAAYDATKALATSAAALHEVTKAKKKCAWIGHRQRSPMLGTHWTRKTAYKLKYCTDAGMSRSPIWTAAEIPKNVRPSGTDLNTALADVDVIIDESYGGIPHDLHDTKAKVLPDGPFGITSRTARFSSASTGSSHDTGSQVGQLRAWARIRRLRPAHVLQGLVHAVWPNSVKAIPDSCVDYFRDMHRG